MKERASIRTLLAASSDIKTVKEAFDGCSTLALLQSTQFDVLTLGLPMLGLQGEDLIREIKGQQPSLRVIVVTALATEDNAVGVFKAGASGFVVKSSLADDLLAAIRRVASGGVYVSL
ncbi:response regulator transcription factor [Paraburkholderia sp. UYCP14C]|uniref:response regulator n=1 Tax=Paraburkholderia sp. UYCP14C TaxID=2511130 RepID=UPI0010222F81|nr:response regulator transcription factor [Paraburkholderia sp. UYCP14C]RZF23709.1 response regulator transcription factor [Paraburkholderia sp. UYCP14C]